MLVSEATKHLEWAERRHGRYLRGIAHRHCHCRDDAEDAYQFALMKLAESGPDSKESVLPWLTTVIKREAWRLNGLHRRYPMLNEEGKRLAISPEPSPQEHAEAAEYRRSRRGALDSLKPEQRIALVLVGLGYSWREVMRVTGWSYTKVNRLTTEGRSQARDQMGENCWLLK